MRRRWRPLALLRALALLAAAAWAAQAGLGAAASWVASRLGPTDVGRWGRLEEAYPGVLLVVRAERLLPSPAAGRVVPLVAEGQSVASGTPVARIEPAEASGPARLVVAPFPGVVSFVGDGWEGTFSPDAVDAVWEPPRQEPRVAPLAPREQVARGEPVARLVDRGELLGVFWSAGSSLPARIAPGARVELAGGAAGGGVPARVLARTQAARTGPVRLVLRIERQPVDWLYRRLEREARLVAGRYEGVVLPASGLVVRRGRQGYWLATEGGPAFVPVEVVKRLGRQVVVQGVPDGVRVYRWPRWLEGF